jgi:hypothetical protein
MSEAGHRLRIYSVGIWSAVEDLGLPWTASGHHRTRPVGRLIFASCALRLATTGASTRNCGCAASSPLAQITPNDIDALHLRCLPFSNAYLEVGVRSQLPRG